MTKKKYLLMVVYVFSIILLLITNWWHMRMSSAYYQEVKCAVHSFEDHVDSMIYNLDIFFENTKKSEVAITFVYLHSVLAEEDFSTIKEYCDNYSPTYSVTQRQNILSLEEKLAEFQNLLEDICVNGMPDTEFEQLKDKLFIARKNLEYIKKIFEDRNFGLVNSPQKMVEAFLIAVDNIDISLDV